MRKMPKALLFGAFLAACTQLTALPEPYASIRGVAYEPYYLQDSWILLGKVNALDAAVFIDVESRSGEAARFIGANTAEEVNVYCINSWKENDHQFQTFLSNVIHEDAAERVIPIRMSSNEAAAALNLIADVIYIDCNDIDAIPEKIMDWVTHLSENGVIAGNRWEWPEVEYAVVNAVGSLNLTLSINGNYWFLQKE